jgi:hypothetical protein
MKNIKNELEYDDELNDEFDPESVFDDSEERRDFSNDDDIFLPEINIDEFIEERND